MGSLKTNISKLQFDKDRRPTQKPTMAYVDYSQTIVLYLFIYLFIIKIPTLILSPVKIPCRYL